MAFFSHKQLTFNMLKNLHNDKIIEKIASEQNIQKDKQSKQMTHDRLIHIKTHGFIDFCQFSSKFLNLDSCLSLRI